jgi:hypothetical protein
MPTPPLRHCSPKDSREYDSEKPTDLHLLVVGPETKLWHAISRKRETQQFEVDVDSDTWRTTL